MPIEQTDRTTDEMSWGKEVRGGDGDGDGDDLMRRVVNLPNSSQK
jgi:hypothetical protein